MKTMTMKKLIISIPKKTTITTTVVENRMKMTTTTAMGNMMKMTTIRTLVMILVATKANLVRTKVTLVRTKATLVRTKVTLVRTKATLVTTKATQEVVVQPVVRREHYQPIKTITTATKIKTTTSDHKCQKI